MELNELRPYTVHSHSQQKQQQQFNKKKHRCHYPHNKLYSITFSVSYKLNSSNL